MKQPLVIVGGGGHAKVVIDLLIKQRQPIIGFTDPDQQKKDIFGIPYLGDDNVIATYDPKDIGLVNGLGTIAINAQRIKLYEQFKALGYCFKEIVHESSIIGRGVVVSKGAQVMAGVVIQSGCRIGPNAIVNTGAAVDHDCVIEAHVHVAPGSVLCGDVIVNKGAHIGAGSCIVQGVEIGEYSIVGAGAVVTRNVESGAVVTGIPAKKIREQLLFQTKAQ